MNAIAKASLKSKLIDADESDADMTPQNSADGKSSSASRLSAFVGATSNFSVQFNFQSLSAAVAIMTAAQGIPVPKPNPTGITGDYPEPVR